jgi:glycosyltransferase involved in cell wall biosynthesis
MKVLWANRYCLADRTSGASLACRELLRELCRLGHEVEVLGAAVADNERGILPILEAAQAGKVEPGEKLRVIDNELTHYLVNTRSSKPSDTTFFELNKLFYTYIAELERFAPDIVMSYGGAPVDLFFAAQARNRGIPFVPYVGNIHYAGNQWVHDVNVILTDSHATAERYQMEQGYHMTPVGSLINKSDVVAKNTHLSKRRYVTFVNPEWSKGAGLIALLAHMAVEEKLDIRFLIVDSRGSWAQVAQAASAALGSDAFNGLIDVVTPQIDMRPIYSKTRVLLAPSLAWESSGRVLAEALLNGIPVMHTGMGGMDEMTGEAAIKIKLPQICHEAPYTSFPNFAALAPIFNDLKSVYFNTDYWNKMSKICLKEARIRHDLTRNVQLALDAIKPLVRSCGNDRVRQREIMNSKRRERYEL